MVDHGCGWALDRLADYGQDLKTLPAVAYRGGHSQEQKRHCRGEHRKNNEVSQMEWFDFVVSHLD